MLRKALLLCLILCGLLGTADASAPAGTLLWKLRTGGAIWSPPVVDSGTLYVEPFARGLGIGNALVETCIRFAQEVGYSAMTLWTHTILESARRIYAAHGFRIVESHTHEEFGAPIQSETWQVALA